MASWIYTLPKNETSAAGSAEGGGRRHSTVRDRSATYLATRTTDAIPTAKPHSSSFMYIRPSTYSEARRTAISRRLFLAQNFRASVILSRSAAEGTITSTVSTTEMVEKSTEDPTSESSNLTTPLDSSESPSPSSNSDIPSPSVSEPTITCTTSVTNLEISPPFHNDALPIDLDGEDCSRKEPSIPINIIANNNNSAITITCAPHSYTSPELVSPISSTCGSPYENWAFRCGSIDTCESPIPLSPRSIDEEDWESIIDDTVSRLTSQCAVSRNAESALKHSASVDWISITSGSVLRNSVSCSSIDSTGSVDDDRNVPCIFNDYCNPKHDQPANEGETPVSYADLYKSHSELLSKSTASLLSLSCDLSIKREDLFNSNNGNGTSSAKSLEGFGCEGKCYLIGEDAVLFVVDGKSKLKAATMDRMVQRLTCDMHNDPEFTSTFLLTYRLFCEGWKMFYALKQRYEATSNYMVKCRVCGVLKQWLEKYYSDFLRQGSFSGTLMEELSSFLEVVKLDHPSAATQLAKLMERKGTVRALTVVMRSPVPNRPRAKATRFIDFDDLEIARQLALIEFEWFKQITPTECLNKSWVEAKQNAPNICNMINKSNTIPFWVATEIVQCDTVDGRVSLLKKFISIAEHCRSLSNYNGLMEILSGLNMTAIYRLKKTWASLSPRVLNTFQSLNQLMSPDANFKVYRELLRKDTQPRVPYLGRYLTDLVFTEDAMPSYTQSSLIHFWKCKSITQIVLDLVSHQQQSYMFETVSEIQSYLMNCKGLTENALLKLSRKLEPKV